MAAVVNFCPLCHRELGVEHRVCPHDGGTVVYGRRIDHITCEADGSTNTLLGGRYRVRGFIGRGAMARVYLAEDETTGEAVAVKILEGMQARTDVARQRFFREARAAAIVRHPTIVAITDVGVRDDGVPFLVLEYLFGEPLGAFLRRQSVVPTGLGLAILREASVGLATAHAAGIVHRDVKPDNVFLVGKPGDPYAVKLLDFGLAKLDQQSGFTKAGTAVGTMEYMAPEQLLTERPDARTDVYGLGVVMYRMFAGNLPFKAKDEAELLARQLLERPPPLSQNDPTFDLRIEAVIAKAIRKRPENRYQSMQMFFEDLERLMGRGTGALIADAPIVEPDAYAPTSSFGRHAAKFFYQRLGMPLPAWATAPVED